MRSTYYVYMMTNRHRSVLYTGMTNSLEHRVCQHETGALPGFTKRYHVDSLVYWDETDDVGAAIAREKQIKGWTRAKKVALIESMNPQWRDLADGWLSVDRAQQAVIDTPDPASPPPDSFAKEPCSAADRPRRSE